MTSYKYNRRICFVLLLLVLLICVDLLEGFVGTNVGRVSITPAFFKQGTATESLGLMTQLQAALTSRPQPLDLNPPQHRSPSAVPPRLPSLTNKEKLDLLMGKRIQKQHRLGRAGYGLVVLDVNAPIDEVFKTLSSFTKYEEMIPTVKGVNIYSANETNCAAEFCLSRFRLRMNVIHHLNQQQKSIRFLLDPSRINPILKFVDGLWTLEDISSPSSSFSASESMPGSSADSTSRTRIYFNIELEASRLVPSLVVDYAASRALPKATAWLQPHFVSKPSSSVSPPSSPPAAVMTSSTSGEIESSEQEWS